jgi:hypothetical protein
VTEVTCSGVEEDRFFGGSGLHCVLRRQSGVCDEYNAVLKYRPEL